MPTLAVNKRARFDYNILEKFEAGLVLSGAEVKSVRQGSASLKGSFVTFRGDEAYLTNATIPRYKFSNPDIPYDPSHSRKLLLKKKEIAYLTGKKTEEGLTIVPLSLYTSGRTIKVGLGVGRGKKRHDKRETIKRRDVNRELRRKLKGN